MRHSKRDYLTCQDVKLAMQKLNVSDVFGYPSQASALQYQNLNFNTSQQDGEPAAKDDATMDTDNSTLWYPKPSQIDLREYVTNPPSLQRVNKSSVQLPISYTLHFTAINGV